MGRKLLFEVNKGHDLVDKVQAGLKCCAGKDDISCESCPYAKMPECVRFLMKDSVLVFNILLNIEK